MRRYPVLHACGAVPLRAAGGQGQRRERAPEAAKRDEEDPGRGLPDPQAPQGVHRVPRPAGPHPGARPRAAPHAGGHPAPQLLHARPAAQLFRRQPAAQGRAVARGPADAGECGLHHPGGQADPAGGGRGGPVPGGQRHRRRLRGRRVLLSAPPAPSPSRPAQARALLHPRSVTYYTHTHTRTLPGLPRGDGGDGRCLSPSRVSLCSAAWPL
mmetsp:Transcript_33372/g.85291  ORF Transcript_33372/g.85291 Transcript_33372/m.85291 type:complete len:212 (-) Transcript_33372:51-686(-)